MEQKENKIITEGLNKPLESYLASQGHIGMPKELKTPSAASQGHPSGLDILNYTPEFEGTNKNEQE